MTRVWFHRRFTGYTGGHGKVWDYFRHVAAHPACQPIVHLHPDSTADHNPWFSPGVRRVEQWCPRAGDMLFLAGEDWRMHPRDDAGLRVVNLIQHVRHAHPLEGLFAYLARPALRICVSAQVAAAILATGRVNGPVHVIEAALDLPAIPERPRQGVFIGALKDPPLGDVLASTLSRAGVTVDLCTAWTPRSDYLERLARCEIAVLLPHAAEGLYLPALEAMAFGCAVVVPDCIGNRDYARDGETALVPARDPGSLANAVATLRAEPGLRGRLVEGGRAMAARFGMEGERARFHALLTGLSEA